MQPRTVTTRGQARVQKRTAGARDTKLPVPIAEKRNRSMNTPNTNMTTMNVETSSEAIPGNSIIDWADEVQQDIEEQQPNNAFDWARSLQQQISTMGRELAQHREFISQLQDLMKENAMLKSTLETQSKEITTLRQELALRHSTQHQRHYQSQHDNNMVIDADDSATQDEIGKTCDTVAMAMTQIAQPGSGTKDSRHATATVKTKTPPKRGYAGAAEKGAKHSRSQKRRSNNVSNPTEGMVSWATRLFASATINSPGAPSPTGYTILYLDSTHRSQHSETRKALTILGVPQGRIIDVHFPVRGIVGLLIHKSFENDLKDILQKAKLKINTQFKPQSADSLKGQQYEHLEGTVAREEKAAELFTDRMLRTCARMPKAYLGAAIIRHFVFDTDHDDPHRMLPSAMTRFNAMRPRKERPAPTQVPSLTEACKKLGIPEPEDGAGIHDAEMDQ